MKDLGRQVKSIDTEMEQERDCEKKGKAAKRTPATARSVYSAACLSGGGYFLGITLRFSETACQCPSRLMNLFVKVPVRLIA